MQRSQNKEILDIKIPEQSEFLKVMKRLAWQNRVTGNNFLIYRYLRKLIARNTNVTVADVGTGLGDIPVYIARALSRDGITASITGIDASPEVLELARQQQLPKGVSFKQESAGSFTDDYDIIIASQMLHHLTSAEVGAFLRTAYAHAKTGIVISDLERNCVVYWLVRFFMYITVADRINRNDGPLSVLRAYTNAELRELLHHAGIENYRIHNYVLRKIVVIWK